MYPYNIDGNPVQGDLLWYVTGYSSKDRAGSCYRRGSRKEGTSQCIGYTDGCGVRPARLAGCVRPIGIFALDFTVSVHAGSKYSAVDFTVSVHVGSKYSAGTTLNGGSLSNV